MLGLLDGKVPDGLKWFFFCRRDFKESPSETLLRVGRYVQDYLKERCHSSYAGLDFFV